ALACDIRLAASGARLGLPHADFGLMPRDGGSQRLPRIVGRAKALEMLLTGAAIDADEAYRIGLVSRVVPPEQLLSDAEALARSIAEKGPIALRYVKEAVNKGLDLTMSQGLRLEADLYFLLQTTHDRTEGIRAFREKRPPQFKGE
ncbi:MAG: enoyl-CoA hydratase-related protein, partial [Chloroflexota bacterium]|nr:enoyl-CoA hydratase-related protein [Chloroflexota bacterium]